jgi:hypothetical protein
MTRSRVAATPPSWLRCSHRLAISCLLIVTLGPLISVSCSGGGNTSETGEKKQTKEAGVNLPPGAMSLSAVLKTIEGAGYNPVTEVEFEKDHWEIKAFRNGQLLQLKVGLLAGEILPNPAPRTQKPLSVIVKGLEDQGYGPILDVERDGGGSEPRSAWDVEAFKGSSEVNVSVDPVSGKITTK